MKFSLTFLVYLYFVPLFSTSFPSSEIRIPLKTEKSLESVYMGGWERRDGSVDEKYLAELESIFSRDMTHNGARVLPLHLEKEGVLKYSEVSKAFNLDTWKRWGVAHVIKGEVKEKKLSLTLFSSSQASLKMLSSIELSGALREDRRTMHRLADTLYATCYGQQGIASASIFYSLKKREGDRWKAEIWVCDADGANNRQLTYEDSYSVTPVYLPPNSSGGRGRLLYVSYKLGQSKIFISSFGEKKGKKLIPLRGNQLLPAISLQKDKIAFISDVAGRADLFMQRFNAEEGEGSKPVRLVSYPCSTQASPTFSPDGSKIAFVSDKDGTPRIYLIPALWVPDRITPRLLTKTNRENTCPSWSPNGEKLAYSAKTKGVRQIWIYDFKTEEEKQLTEGPENKENPSWAFNSKHLVFNSTDGDVSELYLLNVEQPIVKKISQGTGIKHYPVWGYIQTIH